MKSRVSKSAFSADKNSPKELTSTQNNSFPVVAVGASAGGLEAYKEFFHTLPVDTGMAFVLVQHLDPSHQTIRMWAPGCSTGEETYSLAMTLLEFFGDKAASFHVQIFGTDLNEKGIQKARRSIPAKHCR